MIENTDLTNFDLRYRQNILLIIELKLGQFAKSVLV